MAPKKMIVLGVLRDLGEGAFVDGRILVVSRDGIEGNSSSHDFASAALQRNLQQKSFASKEGD